MKRTLLVLGIVLEFLSACPAPKTKVTDAGTLAVSPSTAIVAAGSPVVVFTATGSDSVAWSLNPSVGSLTQFVGATTGYLAPPPNAVNQAQAVTLTATIVNSSVSATATITLIPETPDAGPPGTLRVMITNNNGGSTPNVFVEGDFTEKGPITSSTTVSVPPGAYVAWGQPETSADTIVGTAVLASVNSNPVSVSSNQQSMVSVTYGTTPNAGTGRLWIPTCAGTPGGNIFGLSSGTLHLDGGVATNGALKLATDGGCVEAVALDVNGTVWAADFADGVNGKLWGFAFLPDGGTAPPIIITTQPDGGGPGSAQALAFAKNGDLWVANNNDPLGMGQLIRYTPDQLTQSGSPAPASVISSTPFSGLDSISTPSDMAFSPNGSALWLTNAGNGTVVEFLRTATGDLSPAPSVVIFDNGSHWIDLNGASFDPAGNLWVVGKTSSTLVELDVTSVDLSTIDGGLVMAAPKAVLTTPDAGHGSPLNGVSNLTFDSSGNLWVINNGDDSLVEFLNPGGLSGRVGVPAAVKFTGAPGTDNGRMQFDPPLIGQGLYP